jgi:hypothetical protein
MEFRVNKRALVRLVSVPGLASTTLVAFAILGGSSAVFADPPVDTSATVGGAGANPRIECAWVLPDVNSSSAGIQYGNDDDLAQPSPTPCDTNPSDPTNTPPTQANVPGPPTAGQIHVHIKPNAEDLPEPQKIILWAALDPASGLASDWSGAGFWKVYHPDGSLKLQVEGTKVTPQGAGGCGNASGLSATLTSMFSAAGPGATSTGQLSQNARNWIVARCQQNSKVLYSGVFDLHKYQACGNYRVEFNASGGAAIQKLNYWFNVPCVQQLQIDFASVNFGTILPGQTQNVEGDFVWDIPACTAMPTDPCPTVKNVGNSGMGLTVTFANMIQCSEDAATACPSTPPVSGPKEIYDFDACFGRPTDADIDCLGYTNPNPALCTALTEAQSIAQGEPSYCRDKTWTFDHDRAQTLCANETGKLELSIHPVPGLPPGNYEGSVTVTGFWNFVPGAAGGENTYHCGELNGAISGLTNTGATPPSGS